MKYQEKVRKHKKEKQKKKKIIYLKENIYYGNERKFKERT